ncbi:MAG: hypothetical protein K0S33_373 [Bacteroidetes bacterium]|jgi:uncharacterized repeat protein (TIGR01451 family)|nr:hypothetical protein [Bacteroidota bacterium]
MKKILPFISFLIISTFAKAQHFNWANSILGSNENSKIALDQNGNVYMTGNFQSLIYFNTGPSADTLTSAGDYDGFIAKTDATGNLSWVKQIGGSGRDMAKAVTADSSGNVYITGIFEGTVDFDPGPGVYPLTSFGGKDIFICKLDGAGNFLWVKQIGGTGDEWGWDIETDELNNIYITGFFGISVDFDPGPGVFNLSSLLASRDVFVEKLDVNGNFNWVKQFEGSGTSEAIANAIAVKAGMVYCTGYFSDTVDFDPGSGVYTLTGDPGPVGSDIFVSKLDTSGNFMWAKNFHGTGTAWGEGNSIKVDSYGNVLTSGFFSGTVDFDPGSGTVSLTYSGLGNWDAFVNKLDANGNFLWNRRVEGVIMQGSLALDNADNIYTTGEFLGTIDFDPGQGIYNLSNGADVFISKLNYFGDFVWARGLGGNAMNGGRSITVDRFENIYVSGIYSGIMDFDPDTSVFELTQGNMLGSSFILKLYQDTCSDLSIGFDSVLNVSCSDSGYVGLHAIGGEVPYNYVWNSTLLLNDSTLRPIVPGIYNAGVTDARGCTRQTSVYISGPVFASSFDLEANLVSGNFRPGFSQQIVVDAGNKRCSPVSGSLKVVLDNELSFQNAVPSPDLVSGDTLIWNFISLVFDSLRLNPVINCSTSVSAPIGDTIHLMVSITPMSGDADTSNNYKNYDYPVINGYDPNDKQVYPFGNCIPHYISDEQLLTYTIRFQNTGNASAININVLDSLNSNLDLNSMRVIASSHSVITEVLPGSVLKFRFDNINLPDSTSDEPASHGYVIYEIMPDSNVADGIQIQNRADIYFDFNPPVLTNTVYNTITTADPDTIQCAPAVGIKKQVLAAQAYIYPNPSTGRIDIVVSKEITAGTIKITNLMGQVITKEQIRNTNSVSMEIPGPAGLYFVTITDNKGYKSVVKVVKQ